MYALMRPDQTGSYMVVDTHEEWVPATKDARDGDLVLWIDYPGRRWVVKDLSYLPGIEFFEITE